MTALKVIEKIHDFINQQSTTLFKSDLYNELLKITKEMLNENETH